MSRPALGLAAVVVGTVVAYVAIFGVPVRRPSARVECRAVGALLAEGHVCSVTHESGGRVHACWSLDIACANGVTGSARACGDVDPRGLSSVVVPIGAFGGSLDRCDRAASAALSRLEASEP